MNEDVHTAEHNTNDPQRRVRSDSNEDYKSLDQSLSRHDNVGGRHNHQVGLETRTMPSHGGRPLHIDVPTLPEAAEVALAALQYLPTPVIVLGALKTILVANESMGRLLCLRDRTRVGARGSEETTTEILKGQTLSQIGLDMLSDGAPIW
jgi:hypothetical protein